MACLTLLPTIEFNSPCENLRSTWGSVLGRAKQETHCTAITTTTINSLTNKFIMNFLRTEFELQIAFSLHVDHLNVYRFTCGVRLGAWRGVLHGGARPAGRIVQCRAHCGRWHRRSHCRRLSSHRHRLSSIVASSSSHRHRRVARPPGPP